MRFRSYTFAALLLVVACGDELKEDGDDDGQPDTGVSPPGSDASADATVGSDAANVAPDSAAPAFDGGSNGDAGQDAAAPECPFTMAVTSELVEQTTAERAIGTPAGGTIAPGLYKLTKRELVTNPAASESEKVSCSEQLPTSSRETLEFKTATVVSRSSMEQGAGFKADYVSESDYRTEGSSLLLRSQGVACVNVIEPLEDGGFMSDLNVITSDPADSTRPYTATADTLIFYQVISEVGETVSCAFVSEYRK